MPGTQATFCRNSEKEGADKEKGGSVENVHIGNCTTKESPLKRGDDVARNAPRSAASG